MSTPFQTHERLTAIALAVRPRGFIADLVLPRVSVGAEDFKYAKGRPQETHTIPDTRVGRRSRPNQVEFGADLVSASTQDHALDDPVPIKDIEKARAQMSSWDPLAEASTNTAVLLSLARERRVSSLVTTAATYAAAKRATLAGASQWSHKDSDPIKAVAEALDACLVRPNIMVIGQEAWTGLRRHPKIVEATKMTGAGNEAAGMATKRAVAELFEIDEVIVGQAFYSSAKKGQDAVYARLWGKHCALIHRNTDIAGAESAIPTFGFTAEWMPRETLTATDDLSGIMGSEIVRVRECIQELIAWQDAGYLFRSVVA